MSETAMILHLIGILLLLVWIVMLISRSKNFSDHVSINHVSLEEKYDANKQLIFDFYNKVQMDQARKDIEKTLAVTSEIDEDGLHTYIDLNTGYGVFIHYNVYGKVTLKGIASPDGGNELIALSNVTVSKDQLANIKKGMTYEWLRFLLGGEGIEVVCAANPLDKEKPLCGMAWINPDGTAITVQLDGFKGTVYSAKYREK
jgi:hypothetical protein